MSKKIQQPEGIGKHFESVSLHSGKLVDKSIFGGKGANLSFLATNGLPVPEGFCIGKEAYEHYKTKSLLPPGLIDEVQHLKEKLGGAVAIRSSAVGEDGEDLSMAGVFTTVYLGENESAEDALLKIYSQVNSVDVEKSLAQHGIQSAEIEMGLVVQRLLAPQTSGVVYTGSGEGSKMLIQYVDGLGNTLVDGETLGDTVVVDNKGKLLQQIQVSKQSQLSQETILGLTDLSSQIVSLFGNPNQDIEWALENGQLYILQARPLTTELNINFGKGSVCLLNSGLKIRGIIIRTDDFNTPESAMQKILDLKAKGQNVILVSQAIDLTLDPVLAISDGLLAESASVVSHGAQRSRELGIGAIGGLKIDGFNTGDHILFDPALLSVTNAMGDELLKPLHELATNREMINSHIDAISRYVHEEDPGSKGAFEWLKETLSTNLEVEHAELLYSLALYNKPDFQVEYVEEGYDSCQSNRQVAKIISEILMIGGMIYEANLLGVSLSVYQAKEIIGSSLSLNNSLAANLAEISKKYGENQSFIFPGITPTSLDTPSVKEFAERTLQGTPMVSVRNLTGVGGLRFDKEWNHTTDFKTFLEWKLEEDKRYYPGLGILYVLLRNNLDGLPVIQKLSVEQSELYEQIKKLVNAVNQVERVDMEGVAVLCSAYLPERDQMEPFLETATTVKLDLLQAFHSPAYELGAFKNLFENLASDSLKNIQSYDSVERLLVATQKIWSFNSTIHISWADSLSTMANGLIGQLKNTTGDHSVRYGIGRNGKSFEAIEHNFSPADLSEQLIGYEVRVYSDSEVFSGEFFNFSLAPDDELWELIQNKGFLKVATNYLEDEV